MVNLDKYLNTPTDFNVDLHDSGLYGKIISELLMRKALFTDRYPPFYIASIGLHLFNLANQLLEIYLEGNRVPNSRLHTLMVGPPGFGKTYWQENFFGEERAIMNNTDVPLKFVQVLTEAGWNGTMGLKDGQPFERPGIAKRFDKGIVACEEFSAITRSMEAQHSKGLDTSLLTALDSGNVEKDLGSGYLRYKTFCTLHAGVQQARFDISGGMNRRLIFTFFQPSWEEREALREARRRARGLSFPLTSLNTIQEGIFKVKKLFDEGQIIEINWDGSVDDLLKEYRQLTHWHDALYERLFLGYSIMRFPIEDYITVKVDDEAKRIFELAHKWRRQVEIGPELSQLVEAVSGLPNHEGTYKDIVDEMVLYSWDVGTISDTLRMAVKHNLLERVGNVYRVVPLSTETHDKRFDTRPAEFR